MQAKRDAIYNISCGRAYLVPLEWVEGKPRTFHTVKDLPCDLDCRDDRRKPLVKEYDILNTPLEIVILTMMRRLPQRCEQRPRHPGRRCHSRPVLPSDRK